jgi:hypothetical protein
MSISSRTPLVISTLAIKERGHVLFTAPGVRIGFDPQPDPRHLTDACARAHGAFSFEQSEDGERIVRYCQVNSRSWSRRFFVRHTLLMHTLAFPYHCHRFPVEIISHSVWLYFRFALSFRDVEEMTYSSASMA